MNFFAHNGAAEDTLSLPTSGWAEFAMEVEGEASQTRDQPRGRTRQQSQTNGY